VIVYVAIIQVCLFLLALICVTCELSVTFSDSPKSVFLRYLLAISLLVLSYYAQYLTNAPYPVLLSMFFLSIYSLYFISKLLLREHKQRIEKEEES